MRNYQATANTNRAVTRAVGYSLLASALAYPDESGVASLQECALAALPFLGGTALEPLAAAAANQTQEQLEPVHVALFTLSASPDCPTFETAYIESDLHLQTERMADIAGFYRAFGVENGSSSFRPDDICVELEFMGFLCRKQVYAAEHLGAARVSQGVRAQRLFLEEHLGRWGPLLAHRISASAEANSFYTLAATALEEWLMSECAWLGAKPRPVEIAGVAARFPAEDDRPVFYPDEIPVV